MQSGAEGKKRYLVGFDIRILLLTSMILLTSCGGQAKTNVPIDEVHERKTGTNGQPEMIRKQGTYSYMTYTGPHTDTSVSVSSVIEDRNGSIWVATMGEGVYRYDGQSFANFTVKDGLISNVVYSIMEDREGSIWFGTIGGVSRYDGRTFTNIPFSVIRGTNTAIVKETVGLTPEVWSMLQDNTGNIWFGTSEGLYRYDGGTYRNVLELGTLTGIENIGDLSLRAVPSIIQDRKGNIWFTSWSAALCRFDGRSITSFKPEVSTVGSNQLLEDRNGNIWIGKRGKGGVYRYDGKTFESLLPGISINGMKEDADGNIWFCTFPRDTTSGGVIHYNPSTSGIIARLTTREGISSDRVSSVVIDRSGNVWFGTYGMTLSRYDGKSFTNFLSE